MTKLEWVKREYNGKIFDSLEIDGKRSFPLTPHGMECVKSDMDRWGIEFTKKSWKGMYGQEPDIWDALFSEMTVPEIQEKFNFYHRR